MDKESKTLIAKLGRYSKNPLGWVRFSFKWGEGELEECEGADDWQRDTLKDIGAKLRAGGDAGAIIREAIASGHGIGKSCLVSWLILWAISTFPDTRGVVSANTEKQLKTKTWPEVSTWYRRCWYMSRLFDLGTNAIVSREAGHKTTWRIDQVPWNERNTEAFAGLHNKGRRILLVFDEASAIPDVIWEVSEGALTDEGTEILWCVFGNPTRNSGRFKDCFTGSIRRGGTRARSTRGHAR